MPTCSLWTALAVRPLPAALPFLEGGSWGRSFSAGSLGHSLASHWGRSCLTSRLRMSPMTRLGILLYEFIQFALMIIGLFACLKKPLVFKNNAHKIVQEVASHFLTRRASSDSASVWLDIGQFWGNLARNLTDSNLDVDK